VRCRPFEPAPQVRLSLGVREAARIDDQRRAAGDLDAQRVVVAVPAVAERAAVEDQEPRGPVPAAALDEVPAVRERREPRPRVSVGREVRPVQEPRAEFEQV
jgi:sRNA-binding protein